SAEGFPAPVSEFGDSFRDELRCRLALARARLFHVLILEVPTIESTWACACRTPFRDRSRRAPGRPRVRGRRDRAAREWVLGCSGSPLPVVRENVFSCLHDRVAREPALAVV